MNGDVRGLKGETSALGQKRTLFTASRHVRFAPESGHSSVQAALNLRASQASQKLKATTTRSQTPIRRRVASLAPHLFSRLPVEVLFVCLGIRFGSMHGTVSMVRRRVKRIELHRA